MNEKKPHLWIPEQEVSHIEKTPTSRSNHYDVKHNEHGQKLSTELRDIINFLNHIQTSDSLDEKDYITFKVKLQDKEDFSVKNKFIESEGLTINAIKDKNHAIVSAPKNIFNNLQKRVNRYRDHGIKQDFQYIESFSPFRAEDKHTTSLLNYLKKNTDEILIDIQMMLLPDMPEKIREKAENDIIKKIKNNNGNLPEPPYHMTDGTSILRAKLSPSSLQLLSEDPRIYRIEKTAFFRIIKKQNHPSSEREWKLNTSIDLSSLPNVVILDDGICLPGDLQNVVALQWSAPGCERKLATAEHGTPVASRAAFGYIGLSAMDLTLTPRAKLIDAQIVNAEEDLSIIKMLNRITVAVENFASVAKIFNLSYNTETPIEGDEMSILGSVLDELSHKYNIRFVISAGNHKLLDSCPSNLIDIIEDDDSRISSPADAMLGISVGAVVGCDHFGSLSRTNEIAPYSRRGPGFYGFYKPDLVSYGATVSNGLFPRDAYSLCIDKNGDIPLGGTSFTAPTVAGDLAQILSTVPDSNIGLAQALLYNGTILLYDKENIEQEELDYASNLYGRGLSSPENSIYSSEDKVSFIHYGTMNRREKKRVKFYIPTVIANYKAKRGEQKLRVRVTCITQPPVDRTKGSEYSAAYISASIHRLNSNGKNVCANPTVSDNRTKWDTCYHFSNEFSSFSSGDWEVWLELFTRWDIKDDDEIPYSLVITVEDLTKSGNLYSTTIRESAGRFTAVQSARIMARQ